MSDKMRDVLEEWREYHDFRHGLRADYAMVAGGVDHLADRLAAEVERLRAALRECEEAK